MFDLVLIFDLVLMFDLVLIFDLVVMFDLVLMFNLVLMFDLEFMFELVLMSDLALMFDLVAREFEGIIRIVDGTMSKYLPQYDRINSTQYQTFANTFQSKVNIRRFQLP